MQLPFTSQNLVLWFDPAEKLVNKSTANKVYGVVDKIGNRSISQPIEAYKPSFDATVMNGRPGITFDGGQFLSADFAGQYFNDGYSSFAVTCAVKLAPGSFITNTYSSLFCFGDTTSTKLVVADIVKVAGLDYFSGQRYDGVGDVFTAGVTLNGNDGAGSVELSYDYSKVAIVTLVVDSLGSTVKINVNGTQSSAVGTMGRISTLDKLSIGAVPDLATGILGAGNLTGSMGQMIVYKATSISPDVETYMKNYYGVTY